MRVQFMNLVGFQNSGYLPLALFSAVAPLDMRGSILIYLFLFLTGFNLAMFSVGTCLLTTTCRRGFDIKSMLNPPVVATILGLLLVLIGVNRMIPSFLMKSVKMVGDCTLPLALFVVGGNLALIKLEKIYTKELGLLIAAKLVVLPLMGLLIIKVFGISPMIGLLVLVQLAVPPAVTLSALVRQYKQEDVLISQGIFLGHLVSLITIPVFLSVYFTYFMVN
jgi:predicted permease